MTEKGGREVRRWNDPTTRVGIGKSVLCLVFAVLCKVGFVKRDLINGRGDVRCYYLFYS